MMQCLGVLSAQPAAPRRVQAGLPAQSLEVHLLLPPRVPHLPQGVQLLGQHLQPAVQLPGLWLKQQWAVLLVGPAPLLAASLWLAAAPAAAPPAPQLPPGRGLPCCAGG